MDIASQLREEAIAICNTHIVTVLANAFSDSGRVIPFDIIRRHPGMHIDSLDYPHWQRMGDYQRALQKYVRHKIIARSIERRNAGRIAGPVDLAFHLKQRDMWRALMERIEQGSDYAMP